MTYNPNIPQPTDIPSQSQSQILDNFTVANTVFGINHVPFDATLNNGKHNFATLLNQSGNPATAAGEIALYAKAVGGISTWFLRKETNGTVIQLSNTDPIIANPGSTFLPGGMLLQFGTTVVLFGGSQAILFPIAFSAPPFSVTFGDEQVGLTSSTIVYIQTGTVNATGFTITCNGGGSTIHWMAIGQK